MIIKQIEDERKLLEILGEDNTIPNKSVVRDRIYERIELMENELKKGFDEEQMEVMEIDINQDESEKPEIQKTVEFLVKEEKEKKKEFIKKEYDLQKYDKEEFLELLKSRLEDYSEAIDYFKNVISKYILLD
jgi:hypothetical protein